MSPNRPMKVLVADDDPVSRQILTALLDKWGYAMQVVCNGQAACDALLGADAPKLAILDWMMPDMDGIEVCRQVRASGVKVQPYLILLTANSRKLSVIEGLESGADDYLTKPFDHGELSARLRVGWRTLELNQNLADRVDELQAAVDQIKQLQGLLPICCYCKKIRDDENQWKQVETYVSMRTDATFSHSICPDCMVTALQELEQA